MSGYVAMLSIHGVYCTDSQRHGVTFIWDKTLNTYKRAIMSDEDSTQDSTASEELESKNAETLAKKFA